MEDIHITNRGAKYNGILWKMMQDAGYETLPDLRNAMKEAGRALTKNDLRHVLYMDVWTLESPPLLKIADFFHVSASDILNSTHIKEAQVRSEVVAAKRRSRVRATQPYVRYKREEVELIVDSKLSDEEIARRLGRTIKAIGVKRCKFLGARQVAAHA